MKIGFSFGRCVRDLVKGVVEYDDVLLIYAATCMHEREHIAPVIRDYMWHSDYLYGLDQDACLDMAHRLWDNAKIHQPRVHKQGVRRIAESGVWMDLAPTITTEAQQSELVQKAWRDYQMALKLTSTEAMPADQFKRRTPEEEEQLRKDLDLLLGSI